MSVHRFPIERTEGNAAAKVAELLRALHSLGELEQHLQRVGALKAMYIIAGAAHQIRTEYPEYIVPIRQDGGAA